MAVKAMYNTLAAHYASADYFGSISESHRCAIEQIHRAPIHEHAHVNILDFGVGDGSFLSQIYKKMPRYQFTGIDISEEMLKRARQALPLVTIEASASEASQFIPPASQDLVLAHFINAYIPIHILFNQAQRLTRPQGLFSLITTTYESFPVAQKQLADFVASDSLLSGIVGHYYKSVVKNTTVASGQEELLAAFVHNGFTVL